MEMLFLLNYLEGVIPASVAISSLSEFLLLPKTYRLKFWKAIMTTVTLSRDYLYREFLSTLSTARPHC